MPLSFQVSGPEKDQLVISLAALLLQDSGLDMSADNLSSVVQTSGNTIPSYYAALFAGFIEKAGGLDKYMAGPSAGVSAGGAPCGAATSSAPAGDAPKAAEKPKEEEVDALDGGMDMFGGGGGGGGDY